MTSPTDIRCKPIPATFIDEVRTALTRRTYLRRKLPGWGRIHIDRPLPFLCVYRRPPRRADPGTRQLLLGEASYLLASGDAAAQAGIQHLVQTILASQVEAFGASLLLELWAGGEAPVGAPPAFRIVADRHHAPAALLETLESALLSIATDGHGARVEVDYRDQVAPPGLAPLLATDRAAGVQSLGLEVSPNYRDPLTGELFPLEMQALRHGLAHALKQAFYAFAHTATRQRPAHYHVLGRRIMTSAVRDSDRQLAAVGGRFDLLLHVSPVNAGEAWAAFRDSGFKTAPRLNYRPRPVDPALLKRQLYEIPIERIEDPTLALIFATRRDEMDRQIGLIADRNTPRFLRGSQQVYGEVDEGLLGLARRVLAQIPPPATNETDADWLDAKAFAARAEAELARYREQLPELPARVELRDDISGIMVSRGHFLIGRDARVPAGRVEAALAHEIGTHVLTYHNGRSQPLRLFDMGMADYEPLQEGLAVLAEFLVGQLDRGRLRQLAGRVLAVHGLCRGEDFIATFRGLVEDHGFSEYQAFTIALRVYRGGGFTKDAVYLRGLASLLEYLGGGGDLERLYLGKIALEHVPLVEELQWRRVVRPGPLRPRHLDSPQAQERLAWLRQGVSLERLVEACEQ